MKITKSQLKRIIKEEISKILNEDINTMDPVDVLKQMIYKEVPGKLYGYKIASPENVQDYLEWIRDGVDDLYATDDIGGMKKLQEYYALGLKVIPLVQKAARQGKDFDLRAALGISDEDPKFKDGRPGHLYGPLGDPYADISPSKWYEDLLENRPLFDDLIEMFKKYFYRYIEPGDHV